MGIAANADMRTKTGSKADNSRLGLDVQGWCRYIWTSNAYYGRPMFTMDHHDGLTRASDSRPGSNVRRPYANVVSSSSIPNKKLGLSRAAD